jgi:Outer membrane protein beta-barrel domain
MRGVLKFVLAATTAAIIWAPVEARADGYVSPWVAAQFGSNIDSGRTAVGVDAGGMGAGILGGEVDFGYSPSFFGTQNDFGHNTVITLMGNLIIGIPVETASGAGIRPYLTGGLGLIRMQIDGGTVFNVTESNNAFGWDAGAGVMGFFGSHVGLRGDARYFRVFNGPVVHNLNLGGLNFWRVSAGLVFR